MLTLFRGGSGLWMSPQDAEAIGVADNDWVEAHNRNGILVTRAVVSHRVPQGVCLMYHSKDRQIGTPRSEIDGRRGGTENALTTIAMKPTHMIGGYAQLSWAPNYYGPRAPTATRSPSCAAPPGGRVLMHVKAQVAMVMNLDKCIGCHTCSVTCKGVDEPAGHRVRLVQQRRDVPGQGYPRQWADQARWNGGWELDRKAGCA